LLDAESPARRISAASLGKMPTTSVRRARTEGIEVVVCSPGDIERRPGSDPGQTSAMRSGRSAVLAAG
jgi:hypothetical protein